MDRNVWSDEYWVYRPMGGEGEREKGREGEALSWHDGSWSSGRNFLLVAPLLCSSQSLRSSAR